MWGFFASFLLLCATVPQTVQRTQPISKKHKDLGSISCLSKEYAPGGGEDIKGRGKRKKKTQQPKKHNKKKKTKPKTKQTKLTKKTPKNKPQGPHKTQNRPQTDKPKPKPKPAGRNQPFCHQEQLQQQQKEDFQSEDTEITTGFSLA